MRLSWTLSRYFGLQLLGGIGAIFALFMALMFLGSMAELMRRTSGNAEVNFSILMMMAGLQLPALSERALPFAVMFGALWSYIRLGRNHELVVIRASGVSVWQFLVPGIGIALMIGIAAISVYNPISASFTSRFEQLEAKYLRGQASLLAVSPSGLWLRQADPRGQSVIHALRVSNQGRDLEDVIIFLYEGGDKFIGRIDAAKAVLRDGYWEITDAVRTGPNQHQQSLASDRLATSLTLERIQDSFASPETMSFWDLPDFINVLEEAGFSAVRHRLHWHSLLAMPLLLCAMILIAATFSLRASTRSGIATVVLGALVTGFVLYFLTDLALALGRTGRLPVLLSAWTPAGVSILLGVSLLLHLEDG
jgi:lipopolysaccharide export system permease protein